MASLDLKGKRFGRLVVIQREKVHGARNAMWRCRCDCGNFTVAAASNIAKSTRSCGCLARETAADLLRNANYKQTHGMAGTPEYCAWSRLKLRCYDPNNPKYPDYGGRGISVCDRWRNSFENFFADMGKRPSPKHSIGRKNNDGNYEPSNCRWETAIQQIRNTRFNHIVTIGNLSLCITAWCEALKVPEWKPYEMIRKRGSKRDQPPECASIEEAIQKLYDQR